MTNGSIQKLEEVVQVTETELLEEMNKAGTIIRKEEDLVFNTGVLAMLLRNSG